jgi:heat shock protein HtpX
LFENNGDGAMFNLVKTAILIAAITALLIVMGGMLGGREGVMMALSFALVMNFFGYRYFDQLVLRMTKAQGLNEHWAQARVAGSYGP